MMKTKAKSHWMIVAIAAGMLLFSSVGAMACDLGAERVTPKGDYVRDVTNDHGDVVGMVRQRNDGQWEAVVRRQGALNNPFLSAPAAANGVCRTLGL